MRLVKDIALMALLGFVVGAVLTSIFILFEFGASADLIKLDSLYLDYKNFKLLNDKNRNLLTYPEPAKEGINLGLTTDVLSYGFWDSEVQSITTDAQYRSVALDTRLGLRLTREIEVGYAHKSQHLLDRPSYNMPKFPVEDSLEIKLYIYKTGNGREALF